MSILGVCIAIFVAGLIIGFAMGNLIGTFKVEKRYESLVHNLKDQLRKERLRARIAMRDRD